MCQLTPVNMISYLKELISLGDVNAVECVWRLEIRLLATCNCSHLRSGLVSQSSPGRGEADSAGVWARFHHNTQISRGSVASY